MVRVLLIHTHYTKKGGEDSVFENEYNLLKESYEVEKMAFHNRDLDQLSKIETFKSSIYNQKSKALVLDKICTFKPDVIHIHNLFYVASASILDAAKEKGIPVVMTLHNFRLICNNALLLRNGAVCEKCVNQTFPIHGIWHKCFQNSALKSAQLSLITGVHKKLGTWKTKVDQYIVFSEFLKKKFQNSSLQLTNDQLFVKPNFVSDPLNAVNLDRKPFFLFVGRLSKEKGIDVLLEAAKLGTFKAEIIGGGEFENEVKTAAKENPNVIFHGFQEKGFILAKMRECQALLFPSIWYEGMPMTILESFSTGTPVIISNMHNIKDLVKDGWNGMHFNAGDAVDLEKKVRNWEKENTNDFYRAARSTYEKKYSPSVNLQLFKEVYNKALRSRN